MSALATSEHPEARGQVSGWLFCRWRLRIGQRRCGHQPFDWRNEAVSAAGNGLYVSRGFDRITQGGAQFLYAVVDALLEIDVRIDDPGWPRITAVGLELPGSRTGFSLLEPLDGNWQLHEGMRVEIPNKGAVTLDLAILATVNPAGLASQGPNLLLGIPPGQTRARGSGTRFCVSGPFPGTLPQLGAPGESEPTTIELLLHGVVVGFHRVEHAGPSGDLGVWENPSRSVPLYPN